MIQYPQSIETLTGSSAKTGTQRKHLPSKKTLLESFTIPQKKKILSTLNVKNLNSAERKSVKEVFDTVRELYPEKTEKILTKIFNMWTKQAGPGRSIPIVNVRGGANNIRGGSEGWSDDLTESIIRKHMKHIEDLKNPDKLRAILKKQYQAYVKLGEQTDNPFQVSESYFLKKYSATVPEWIDNNPDKITERKEQERTLTPAERYTANQNAKRDSSLLHKKQERVATADAKMVEFYKTPAGQKALLTEELEHTFYEMMDRDENHKFGTRVANFEEDPNGMGFLSDMTQFGMNFGVPVINLLNKVGKKVLPDAIGTVSDVVLGIGNTLIERDANLENIFATYVKLRRENKINPFFGLQSKGGSKKLKGKGVPDEKDFFKSAKASYDKVAPKNLGNGFLKIADGKTIDAYLRQSDKTILLGSRGTDPLSPGDLMADAVLFANRLSKTGRYKTDKAMVQAVIDKFPTSDYDYHIGGHSLGGAILTQLKRDFPGIKTGVGFNSAFQTADLTNQPNNIKRIYTDTDFLYRLGGKYFRNSRVIPADVDKAKGFFNIIRNKLTPSAVKGHSLENFEKIYKGGQHMVGGRDFLSSMVSGAIKLIFPKSLSARTIRRADLLAEERKQTEHLGHGLKDNWKRDQIKAVYKKKLNDLQMKGLGYKK